MEASATNVVQATHGGIRSLFRRSGLSIRFRLIACFIVIVFLIIAADAAGVWQYRQIEALEQRVVKTDQISNAVVRIHLNVYSFRDRIAELASSHDIHQFSNETTAIRRSFLEQVDYAEQMLRATPDIEQDPPIFDALESLRVTLLSQLDTAVQLATAGEWNAVQLRAAIEIPALIEFSSSLVERVDQQAQQQRSQAMEDAQKARQRFFIIVPIAALLTLLAAAALGWYVTQTITGPLSVLTASAEALARGDFQQKVDLPGKNELAVLGNAFNYASQQLQTLYEDLRQIERELRGVINTVPAHVWRASPDGAVDFVNERLLRFVGLSPDDILGWNWESVIHSDDRGKFVTEWRMAVKDGQSIESEARLRRAVNGEYRWFLVRAVPLREETGTILKWYGVLTDIEERKRTEKERERLYRDLADREAKIGRLVEANVVGIVMWNLDGAITGANEAFLHMVQYNREDLASGRIRWTDLTPAEWRHLDERAIAELKASGVFQPVEKEYFRKDGSRVPILVGGALFEDSGNEGVAFILDLSDQKRTEEALRRSEAYLAEGQCLTHTGSWALNVATRQALHSSAEHTRLFGFDPENGVPLFEDFLQRVHPEDQARVLETFQTLRRSGGDLDLLYRIAVPGGPVRYMHAIGHPVLKQSSTTGEYVGVTIDITERTLAEEALRRSENYLAQAQQLAQIGSWAWDIPKRNALHLSEEWCRMYGFDPKDGMPSWEERLQRIHPEDRARVQAQIQQAITETSDFDLEFRIVPPHTSIRFIHSVGQPVVSPSGELLQFVGVSMDVTQSKQAEEERERLQQELAHLGHLNRVSTMGELTASLAHEVKQPLTAALTNAETCLDWLRRDRPDVDEACETAARVVSDVSRAASIITSVSSLFKKGALQREPVNVNDLIREMVNLLGNEALRNSVTIQTELAENVPRVNADRLQLQQVLMNLMLNGIQAMQKVTERRELSIKSEIADAQVLVSVTDLGVGLPPNHGDRIFKAFFTTKKEGTGMGLALSRSILESHGGRLWATANSAKGATFRFTLPAMSSAADA